MQAIKEGQVLPPVVQLSLLIEPDPSKFGNSSKLLRLSTLYYLLGGLLSCLTLLFTLSAHWSVKDLAYHHDTQMERDRIKRLRQSEEYLKVQLLRFIVENGGTISGWRRGEYIERERARKVKVQEER